MLSKSFGIWHHYVDSMLDEAKMLQSAGTRAGACPAPETASETTQETSPELQTNPENYTYRMHLQDLQDAVTYSVDIGMSRIR